ncbi:hypothetical protein, partial [Caballeronia humi]|uniref:hypothetical protein n=1 Tax=Caballeronia humi TaxID=326474 RepID=UPI001F3FD857
RVKVGNRQAPHASNKNPTPKVGFLRFYASVSLVLVFTESFRDNKNVLTNGENAAKSSDS